MPEQTARPVALVLSHCHDVESGLLDTTPEACAALVAFLCSADGGRVNGRVLRGTAVPAE